MHSASNMDYHTLFACVQKHLQQSGEGRLSSEIINQAQHNIRQKLANLQPSIMLYGIYNAGKSTLLNALLGQNKADVSDRPETSAITEYAWQSYRIFDTPGVDAPVEHQQITEQHLQQVEVVLFVMSTNGAFDESDIYRRLAAVLKNGQRLIIILNNKIGTSEAETHAILQRISQHLSQQLTDQPTLLQDVSVIALNAKTALKGRLENKALLIEKSNIGQLETTIHQKMAQTSLQDSLKTLAQLCLTPLDALIAAITDELANSQEQALIQQLNAIGLLKQNLEVEVERAISQQMPLLEDELRDLLYDGDDDTDALQQSAHHLIQEHSEAVLNQYRQALGSYNSIFKLNIEDVFQGRVLGKPANQAAANEEKKEGVLDSIKPAMDAAMNVLSMFHPVLAGIALVANLPSRIAHWIGSFFSGSNEAELQARLLSANKEAGSIRYQVERELHAKLTAYTDDIMDDISKPLADSKHILDDKSQALLLERETTRELETQLRQLIG
jgi:GTP-binding protein EngB required for normal cell division